MLAGGRPRRVSVRPRFQITSAGLRGSTCLLISEACSATVLLRRPTDSTWMVRPGRGPRSWIRRSCSRSASGLRAAAASVARSRLLMLPPASELAVLLGTLAGRAGEGLVLSEPSMITSRSPLPRTSAADSPGRRPGSDSRSSGT